MQKISSIHKLIQQILGPHELNDRSHFWPDPPKKSLGYFLLSWICTTLQKISFVPSIHSWDTANFRVQWTHCSHPFLTTPMQKIFGQLLIDLNLHQHAKKIGYFIDLFWRYGWLKNPAIWLAENILAHISGTKIFPNMGFVQEHSK